MTQLEEKIALRMYLADFKDFRNLWNAIEMARTNINAAEGIDFTSKLLEIRIPFGFPYTEHFKNITKTEVPYIAEHAYKFIACLGTFNWCIIFDSFADFEKYSEMPIISPFYITHQEAGEIMRNSEDSQT
jgi:hypothetical protein